MEYALIALASAVIGGLVGRSKGSSFWIWFMVAGALPFLGVAVAFLYRNERNELRRACPRCAKVVPIYQALCTRCGLELDYPEDDELIAPESYAGAVSPRDRTGQS